MCVLRTCKILTCTYCMGGMDQENLDKRIMDEWLEDQNLSKRNLWKFGIPSNQSRCFFTFKCRAQWHRCFQHLKKRKWTSAMDDINWSHKICMYYIYISVMYVILYTYIYIYTYICPINHSYFHKWLIIFTLHIINNIYGQTNGKPSSHFQHSRRCAGRTSRGLSSGIGRAGLMMTQVPVDVGIIPPFSTIHFHFISFRFIWA